MRWLSFEPSQGAYRADFWFYGATSLALGAALLAAGPRNRGMIGWAVAGVLSWTLLEYLLHRFVLHGLPPFRRWHAEHHRRPAALIAAPTLLTAAVFSALALPAVWWLGAWPAAALGFGLLSGYLAYGLTHHAIHQPPLGLGQRVGRRWLQRRRLWHALHHRRLDAAPGGSSSPMAGCYGVSSAFWDRVFGTGAGVKAVSSRTRPSRRSRP